MHPVVSTNKDISQLAVPTAPTTSRLFTELLDLDHDAWRVSRIEGKWIFYREVGGDRSSIPLGSVVITTEPGKPPTLDFYSARGKRSLVTTYADELPGAISLLVEREHVISLFTKLARGLDSAHWDNYLTFCGANVMERRSSLSAGTDAYLHLVGDAKSLILAPTPENSFPTKLRYPAGIVVSQYEHETPLMQCSITYPRAIEATFFCSRLTKGLDLITETMVSLVIQHNRNLEERYREPGDGTYS